MRLIVPSVSIDVSRSSPTVTTADGFCEILNSSGSVINKYSFS